MSKILQAKQCLRPYCSAESWLYYNCSVAWPKLKYRLETAQHARAGFIFRCAKLPTRDEFTKLFESQSLPCVLPNGDIDKHKLDSLESIYNVLGMRTVLECKESGTRHAVRIKLQDFISYQCTQQDRSPIYVFDRQAPLLRYHVKPSPIFTEDYFSVIPAKRPPYRWDLLGPERSGSSLHVDPLQTSAWNALFVGKKLWVLFSPNPTLLNEDEEQEIAMMRAIDFFEHRLSAIIRKLRPCEQFYYFIQHAGETVYVPNGWHHAVLNLEDTVAVTQNWVGSVNFSQTWKSIRVERKQLALSWKLALKRSSNTLHRNLYETTIAIDAEDSFDLEYEIAQEKLWQQAHKLRRIPKKQVTK